jgi:quinol monooxygenase YgiN
MIVGTLRVVPAPHRRAEVLEVFRAIQGPVQAQPGCVGYHIYEEECAERAVVVIERWESQAALDAHLRSESYRRVLSAIELSGSPPEVRFE